MAEKFIADKNIHDGHRSRMRAKFLGYGADIFDTYELLEMLLYNVIPYKDTNPIAKRLLFAFNGIDGVFRANKEELMQVDGIGARTAEYLIKAGMLSELIETEPTVRKTPFDNYGKIGMFFSDYFKSIDQYKISLLLLDNNMLPISVTDLFNTDFKYGTVLPCKFLTEAIRESASVAVIAHTHPFSLPSPCPGDISTNHLIQDALSSIGVNLIEHYIISGSKYYGFMEHPPMTLSAENGVDRFIKSKEDALSAATPYIPKNDFCLSGTTEGSYEVRLAATVLEPLLAEKSLPLAHALYIKYFSFERALAAPIECLTPILGERAAFYIKLLAKITSRRKTDKLEFGQAHTEAEITDFLKAKFLGESVEKLYLLSLDKNRRIISCDLISEGTVNCTNVIPRKILETAIERSASYAVISHNHPRGNVTPSNNDTFLTLKLLNVLLQAKITLLKHYIISGNDCFSVSTEIQY